MVRLKCCGSWVAIAAACLSMWGCAPKQLGPAVNFYADARSVRDGAARRCAASWFLRFNELMISDLDDAISEGRKGDVEHMRSAAARVLRAANGLAVDSAGGEIDRLGPSARTDLARRTHGPATAESLKDAFAREARTSLDDYLVQLERLEATAYRDRLAALRASIEPAPDDRGRTLRQLTLAWGALPAWIGVHNVEKKLDERVARESEFEQSVAWLPDLTGHDDLATRLAPAIIMESPKERSYPPEFDRVGEVYLTGQAQDINVNVNTSRPMIYWYTSEAKIHDRRYSQIVYSWWFPHRPAMEKNDPAAGHIDGDTFRITLDSKGQPAVFEVMQSCGCGHLVYVSESLEQTAEKQFGKPKQAGKLAVEKENGKHDLQVMGAVSVPADKPRPVVYVMAGYHSVANVTCQEHAAEIKGVLEKHAFEVRAYGTLERLPLGDGIASMFGPDGLVHNAGREEGWLLAPTGMLSAGQPRKRGTQKIRWDEYSFDDPHLLEKALQLPDAF